jgi:dGTPase
MAKAVIDESAKRGKIAMSADVLHAMRLFREFMFERVYMRPAAVAQADRARLVIHQLVDHLLAHPDEIPATYRNQDADGLTQALDFVAGMTDRYALSLHDRLFRPRGLV